jgi:hypothetical protein
MHGVGGGQPPDPEPEGDCPKTGYVTLCQEAWAAGGLYWATSDNSAAASQPSWDEFKTFAMNSGQTWTRPESDRNKPGQQFPVGPNIIDSEMLNVGALPLGAVTIQGLSCNKQTQSGTDARILNCTKTCTAEDPDMVLQNVYFKDVNFGMTGNGGCIIKMSNFTGEAGLTMSLANTATGGYFSGTGSPSIEVSNYKLTYDPVTTHPTPELYGTTAAAGITIATAASFTGTFSQISDASPGFLTVSGNSGTMYRSAYIDWPGRVYSTSGALPVQTEYVQLLWNALWIGNVSCKGNVCTINSTSGSSPNPLPVFSSGNPQWMSWGININSTSSRQGVFVTGTTASTITLSGSPSFGATATDVVVGVKSCTGAACDGAVWTLSCGQNGNVPAGACHARLPAAATDPGGAMAMSASPSALKAYSMNMSVPCGYYKSRFAYSYKTGNDFIGRGNCAIDVQGNYIQMSSGQIGYAENGSNRGGVPHTNGPVIQQVQSGFGTITQFSQKNNTILSDRWNVTGNITALGSLFSNSGAGGDNQVNWTLGEFADSLLIANRSANNLIMDGTYTASSGNIVRYLGQTPYGGTRKSRFIGTLTSNGDGTGKLNVVSGLTGAVAVGDWLLNCPSSGCQAFYTGPARITAQIATEPGALSTWTTNYWYGNVSGQIDTYTYVPTIGTFRMTNNDVDNYSTGTGVLGVANEVPVTTFECTNNMLMVPNTAYTGFGCN